MGQEERSSFPFSRIPAAMSSAETDEGTEAFLSRLASASEAWSKFDLSQRVAALSAAAGAAREARDTSQVARKVLAASTKGLRRSVKAAEAAAGDGGASTTELAEAVKRTVKAYQGEIDNLTLRCKASDGAVSDLLGAARGLDDPAPLLRSGRANLDAKVGQIHHLLGAMEEMNDEVMRERERNDRQATDLEDLRRQLTEHAEEAVGGDGGAPGNGGEGVTLTAKEKEELIQLRREVAEYEVRKCVLHRSKRFSFLLPYFPELPSVLLNYSNGILLLIRARTREFRFLTLPCLLCYQSIIYRWNSGR